MIQIHNLIYDALSDIVSCSKPLRKAFSIEDNGIFMFDSNFMTQLEFQQCRNIVFYQSQIRNIHLTQDSIML